MNGSFFATIFEVVKTFDCVYNIVGGDFNTVLEPAVDRNSDVWYNKNARDKIVEIMNVEEYFDIWRIRNGCRAIKQGMVFR